MPYRISEILWETPDISCDSNNVTPVDIVGTFSFSEKKGYGDGVSIIVKNNEKVRLTKWPDRTQSKEFTLQKHGSLYERRESRSPTVSRGRNVGF